MAMRQSFTAVVERNMTFTADFETEPYEAAWAAEARWFIHVLELDGEGAALTTYPQVSPDGLFWCDEGADPLVVDKTGLSSLKVREFGQWLRLRCELTGHAPRAKVIISLSLKG